MFEKMLERLINFMLVTESIEPRYRGDKPEIKIRGVRPQALLIPVFTWVFFGILFGVCYRVPSDSKAVVERLGKYYGTYSSGIHFKLPFIDDVHKVVTERLHRQEMGFRTNKDGDSTTYLNVRSESEMFTKDERIVDLNWTNQYYVTSVFDYLYNFEEPEDVLWFLSQSIMRDCVAGFDFDSLTTVSRELIQAQHNALLDSACSELKLGIRIDGTPLQDVDPPEPVFPAFREVTSAREAKEKLVLEGVTEYNRIVPESQGIAQKKISEAKGYAQTTVGVALGDSSRFAAVWSEYKKNPDTQRARLVWQTLAKVLKGKKIIIENGVGSLKHVNLNDLFKEKN